MNGKICFKPIGIIHSPFTEISGVPIQPLVAKGIRGTIELNQTKGSNNFPSIFF